MGDGEKEERDRGRTTGCYGSGPWLLNPEGENTGHLWAEGRG